MPPTTESYFVEIYWAIMIPQSYANLVDWHYRFQTPSVQAPVKRVVWSAENRKASNARRKKPAPFKCEFNDCDSTFTRKTNLQNHIRAHLGEKIGCPSCRKEYSTRGSMVRHHKTAHRVQPAIDM